MSGLTALGIAIEGIGLVLAAIGLLKAWGKVADGHSLLTGTRPPRAHDVSGRSDSTSGASGGPTVSNETADQAIAEIRTELRNLGAKLEQEATARKNSDDALRTEIAIRAQIEVERATTKTRGDLIEAVYGLYWAIGGLGIQFIGSLLGM